MNRNAFVLVTGGAGYVGSHACKALYRAGFTPVCYDNLQRGHRSAVRWGPLEEGDLLDPVRLDAIMERYLPAAVMHFAALAEVSESVRNPDLYYRNNVDGSRALIETMQRHNVRHMVFSSTCAVYGKTTAHAIGEEECRQPVNPYGATKLEVEGLLQEQASSNGLRYVALRYFNAAGADSDGETGERHDPETHLIPLVLDVVLGRREYIAIHGNDYDTADGTCVRDYVHVSDIAGAHVLAMSYLLGGGVSGAFNLGIGHGLSVLQIIELARRITGHAIPHRFAGRRDGDPPRLVADSRRARAVLGWDPQHSDPANIVHTAWNWQRCRW